MRNRKGRLGGMEGSESLPADFVQGDTEVNS
jgi:hypothetical protein